MNLKLIGGALGLVMFSAVAAVSCSSSDSKRLLVPSDGGEGGEAPTSAGGAGTGATGGRGGASGGGAVSGVGGESGVGQGGADAGAGGVTNGEGGEGGASPVGLLLFNTGVNEYGVALAGGAVDPHYTLIQSPDATFTGPDAIVVTQIAEGYWLPQTATARWIAPSENQSYPGATPCNASGSYVWRTTFDLTGYNPSTFEIKGGWAADNSGADVRLNGVSLGITAGGYNPLTPFTIQSGFVAGKNTLDFEVTDIGCPNGLRVEFEPVTLPPT